MFHNPAEDLKRLLQMGNLGQSIPSSLTPNALYNFAPTTGGTAAATAAVPATGGMSMLMPLIAMAANPVLGGILGGGQRRSAPPPGRAGMGRVGSLPAIYQNNPMQFKAMLAQFLRGG